MTNKSSQHQSLKNRKDIIVADDEELSLAISTAVEFDRAADPTIKPGMMERAPAPRERQQYTIRKTLLEDDRSDPNAYERIIGENNLTSVNFLSRGIKAANAVCRIKVPSRSGGWHGTGFLIGPELLMTNNHVLSSSAEAAQAEAEFGYEHDSEGALQTPVRFNLSPHDIFFTSIDLDVTLVSVVPFSEHGAPLERYGHLPLLPLSGKGVSGEWVTICQHPGGRPKQMTIRKSQIIKLSDAHKIDLSKFIHYTTDTLPGSSGAPVLNDQWQVVAIHHKAILAPGAENRAKFDRGEKAKWAGNEGVRISAISKLLESERFSNPHAAKALDRIERALGVPSILPVREHGGAELDQFERDRSPHKPQKWKDWKPMKLGYDPKFFKDHPLDLKTILSNQINHAAPTKSGGDPILDYLHFSCVVHNERKFPIITAVNIKGDSLVHPGKRAGKFRVDIRMDEEFQPHDTFYERKLGDDPVQFSRGHMVRRFDPCWGTKDEARIAEDHTFHYSNAAPQVQALNGGVWLNIEDYVLRRAQAGQRRVTVFTGPIFRDHDPIYGKNRDDGPWQIPLSFWKVAVIEKEEGIAATAFIRGQTKLVQALYESRVFTNLRQHSLARLQSDHLQVTIAAVEEETGLDFSALRPFDAINALESTRHTRFVFGEDDIIL